MNQSQLKVITNTIGLGSSVNAKATLQLKANTVPEQNNNG